MTDDAWDLFWANSGLTPATGAAFAERIAAFPPAAATATGEDPSRLCTFPTADVPLRSPNDRLSRLTDRRRSSRAFGPGPLSARRLGSLLGPLAARPDGSRGHPSAGALYPLEVFCLCGDVGGGLAGTVCCYNPDNHSLTPVGPLAARPDGSRGHPSAGALYPVEVFCLCGDVGGGLAATACCYNPDNHSLTPVGPLPPWPEWSGALNLAVDGVPQVVLLFVLVTDRVVAKYGAMGGRFALIEVGHAAQNLALRLAADGLAGCEAGGVVEADLLRLVRLDGTAARVALAYACGLPA